MADCTSCDTALQETAVWLPQPLLLLLPHA
jgi:hypothetical protein